MIQFRQLPKALICDLAQGFEDRSRNLNPTSVAIRPWTRIQFVEKSIMCAKLYDLLHTTLQWTFPSKTQRYILTFIQRRNNVMDVV